MALSVLAITHAKPGMHADGNGLYLQVGQSRSKSWIFRYQLNRKRREMGLGSADSKSLADFRAEAAALKAMVDRGIDPIDDRRKQEADSAAKKSEEQTIVEKNTHTFSAVAKAYIAANRKSWKSDKHAQQWENTLATYAFPFIGSTPVADIGTEEVLQILTPIWTDKTETATRVRSRIELVLEYAKARKWRTGENPALWRGNLKSLLAKPTRLKKVKHHPALPWKQMSDFIPVLRQCDGIAARALEFAILTAARSGEVRGATWREIDFDEQIWSVPGNRMKTGVDHNVPLSTDAVELLRAIPRVLDNGLVFPGVRKGTTLSDMSLSAVLRRLNSGKNGATWVDKYGNPIVPHGFRSSFRDWVGDATDYPNEMGELAIAHTIGDEAEKAYRRSDMVAKRRRMMEDWAKWCRPVKSEVPVTAGTEAT